MNDPRPISPTDPSLSGTPAQYCEPGPTDAEIHRSRIRQAIADIDHYASIGDQPLAEQSRRTLDTLCASADGYPDWVRAELRARDLRDTP